MVTAYLLSSPKIFTYVKAGLCVPLPATPPEPPLPTQHGPYTELMAIFNEVHSYMFEEEEAVATDRYRGNGESQPWRLLSSIRTLSLTDRGSAQHTVSSSIPNSLTKVSMIITKIDRLKAFPNLGIPGSDSKSRARNRKGWPEWQVSKTGRLQ